MKIAIIGAGISGLSAAYHLHDQHDIQVFEQAPNIGGHTATVDVELDGQNYAIDTGFIVFNDWTYPNFIELINELGVESKPTEMSFSVSSDTSAFEFSGSNLNGLFAQRSNVFRPRFLGMIKDILRFNREAILDLESDRIEDGMRLGQYLKQREYGEEFINRYLIPMGSAIWSASTTDMIDFPLKFFVRFFKNHGLLSVNHRPQWRVIRNGSRSYLAPLTKKFKESIVTNSRIKSVKRFSKKVQITMLDGQKMEFDHLVMACHSDQTLALLSDASEQERDFLSAIPYAENDVVLHTDETLLPKRKRAWASWNYRLREANHGQAVLTYNMNILQGFSSDKTFCVSLNTTDTINPEKILGCYQYSHPAFSLASVSAVKRFEELNGLKNTWFAGAYMGNGFHEDGVVSGKNVARSINDIGKIVYLPDSITPVRAGIHA